MRYPSSAAISMRSAVSHSTRAISLFSKCDSSIQLYRVAQALVPAVSHQERPHEWGRGRQECLRHGIRPFGFAERQFCMQPRRLVLSVVLLTFPAAPAVFAQSNPIAVVNAASYDRTIASDSLATIFGANLAQTTASATLDPNGQLPTKLASTSVEINGVLAPLVYVSPGQINLVVPTGLSVGTATVLIRSTTSGSTISGAALVTASAPGLFTNDASGAGPGAILNAVTYRPAPFLVQTTENGADTRTRIAVYGTGLRYAGKVTAQAQDTA